jgi:hypothetical protein
MEEMAQEWTEGRLDELSGKVDKGFERVESEVQTLRLEMRTEFTETRTEFTAVRAEINDLRGDMKAMGNELTGRLDSIHRVMIQMMVALTAAILAGFAGICTLIAAEL